MFITLEYVDGTKTSKEIDSSSIVSIDGIMRNGNGEAVPGPSIAVYSCEGLVGIEVTEEAALTPEEIVYADQAAAQALADAAAAELEQQEADARDRADAEIAAAAKAQEEADAAAAAAAMEVAPLEVPAVVTPPAAAPATEKPKGRFPWSS